MAQVGLSSTVRLRGHPALMHCQTHATVDWGQLHLKLISMAPVLAACAGPARPSLSDQPCSASSTDGCCCCHWNDCCCCCCCCCLLHVHPLSAGGGVGGPTNHVGIRRVLPELQAAAGDADSRADGLLQRFSTQLLKQVPFGVLQAQVTLLPMWDLAVNAAVVRPLTGQLPGSAAPS